MDIFRVLTRSSGRPKKPFQPAGQTRAKPTVTVASASTNTSPVAPPPPELDFFSQGPTRKDDKTLGKRKRKDSKDGEEHEYDDPSSEDSDGEQRQQGEGLLDGINGIPQPPTEEDVRKLVKEHKLKITLMNPAPPPPRPLDDSKKRKSKKSKIIIDPTPLPQKINNNIEPILITSFHQLRSAPYVISKRLYQNLLNQGYTVPTPVQMASLPLLFVGHDHQAQQQSSVTTGNGDSKKDELRRRATNPVHLVTCAPTGSGKTLAYLLPLMDWVLYKRAELVKSGEKKKKCVKGVILAPTKELMGQIYNEGLKLSIGTGMRISILKKATVGRVEGDNEGESDAEDEHSDSGADSDTAEKANTPKPKRIIKSDIVISTPTIFLHAIQNCTIDLTHVDRLILDEADVLLERSDAGSGFGEETLKGWEHLLQSHGLNLDTKLAGTGSIRVWMWSATISSGVEELAANMMGTPKSVVNAKPPKTHLGDNLVPPLPPSPSLLRLIIGLKDTSLPTITHKLIYTATERGKLFSLRNLFQTSFPPPALIFLQTIPRATALQQELLYDLPPGRLEVLHSSLSDSKREHIMDQFRKGEIWALITTDLLSRGVDWKGVNVVVNYDIPTSAAGYIHRAGRTGRAGREGGIVYTYYTKEDVKFVKPIANVIAQSEKLAAKGGKNRDLDGKDGERSGVQWLLDYLPNVKKEDKKRLKKYGVENRNNRRIVKEVEVRARPGIGEDEDAQGESGRPKEKRAVVKTGKQGISTVSGWEKQKMDRRKKAIEASKRRKQMKEGKGERDSDDDDGSKASDEEEWTGF